MPTIRVELTRSGYCRADIETEVDAREIPNTFILESKANQIANGLLKQARAGSVKFEEEHDHLVEVQGVYLLFGDGSMVSVPLDPRVFYETSQAKTDLAAKLLQDIRCDVGGHYMCVLKGLLESLEPDNPTLDSFEERDRFRSALSWLLGRLS